MKNAISISIFLLLPFICLAQIQGSGTITTQSFEVTGLERLDMQLYAHVTVDASVADGITITGDENLIPLIQRTVRNGRMTLQQTEWIQPSQPIKITIGGSTLSSLEIGVHETVKVINLEQEAFIARALIGKIELSGTVDNLSLNAERGTIDATALVAENVYVNLWDAGHIMVGEAQEISGTAKENGRVRYANPKTLVSVRTTSDATVMSVSEASQIPNEDHRFIQFELKNNSLQRIQCFVSGPKPEGGRFGYGFPMNPGQIRHKDWSVGSKVYQVNALGIRTLLYEIQAADEGQVVKLYQ